MTNVNIEKIIELSKDRKFDGKKSKMTMEKGIDAFAKVNNSKVGCLYLPITAFYMISGILAESKEVKAKMQTLMTVFPFSKDEITGDLTTFIESKGNLKAYVNDLQYDASIPTSSIKNLQILWGDAYFEKLDDFSKLESLKAIIGNLYTTTGKSVEQLKQLEIITGSIYTKDDNIVEKSNDILYVGGSIYNTRNGDVVKTYRI